jgi:predicted small lipoprotein YifL
MRAFCLLFLLACLMQGCGLKGNLYLPTAEQRQEEEERLRALAAREQREREAEAMERERRMSPAVPEQSVPPPTEPAVR